jgi:hypothetical protein
MKKIFFILFLSACNFAGHATELHIDNLIINFPCLANTAVQSGDTSTYQCNNTKIACKLQIITSKDKQDYDQFIKKSLDADKGILLRRETRTINSVKAEYFSFTFSKDSTSYLSESLLYIGEDKVIYINSIKKNDGIKIADSEIFFNSVIFIK